MVEDVGRSPDGSGHSAEPEPISVVSAVPASVPNAEEPAGLEQVAPERLGAFIAALGDTIALYQNGLSKSLEERHRTVDEDYQREREFLADIMAEYVRLTSFVARGAAEALERTALDAEAERT